jgi:hypothetical protein
MYDWLLDNAHFVLLVPCCTVITIGFDRDWSNPNSLSRICSIAERDQRTLGASKSVGGG